MLASFLKLKFVVFLHRLNFNLCLLDISSYILLRGGKLRYYMHSGILF